MINKKGGGSFLRFRMGKKRGKKDQSLTVVTKNPIGIPNEGGVPPVRRKSATYVKREV